MGYGDGSFLLLCRVFSPTHSCQVYLDCSLHLCVEFLFLVVRSRLPPPACRLSHFLTHTTCPHTTYSHTTYSHTTCNHTNTHITHTQLTHTHNLSTHSLSPQLTHTQLVHTQPVTTRLTHTPLRGRRGTYDTGLALVARSVPVWRRGRRSSWQAWRLATSTSTLRGRRGTYGTGLALVARLVPVWRRGRRSCLPGRRGAWRHRPSLYVAGVALGDIDLHFAWQAWHLWHWAGSGGALGSLLAPWAPPLLAWQAWRLAALTVTLRGRRGASRHRCPLCVASVALMALGAGSGGALGSRLAPWAPRLLVWQAWRLAALTVTLPGRRGTWRHGSPLCVAGVALGDIDLHFAWPAWHLRHWAGSGGALGSRLAPWAPRLFAWQAWRLSTHNLLSHNLSHTQLAHKFMFTSPLSSNVF